MASLQVYLLLLFAYVYKKKATNFSNNRLYMEISTRRQARLSQWKYCISCTNFFIIAIGE